MPYISRHGLFINWLDAVPHKLDNKLSQAIYRNFRASPNVEDAGSIALGSQDVGFHYIFDEGKISCLLAIAKNDGRFVFRSAAYEIRNDSRILRIGVLPWTIDIEISQASSG